MTIKPLSIEVSKCIQEDEYENELVVNLITNGERDNVLYTLEGEATKLNRKDLFELAKWELDRANTLDQIEMIDEKMSRVFDEIKNARKPTPKPPKTFGTIPPMNARYSYTKGVKVARYNKAWEEETTPKKSVVKKSVHFQNQVSIRQYDLYTDTEKLEKINRWEKEIRSNSDYKNAYLLQEELTTCLKENRWFSDPEKEYIPDKAAVQ